MGLVRGWEGETWEEHLRGAAVTFVVSSLPQPVKVLELVVLHIKWMRWAISEKTRETVPAQISQEGRKKGWLLLRSVD